MARPDTPYAAGVVRAIILVMAEYSVGDSPCGTADVRTALGAGAFHRAAKAIVHWRALTRRVDTPFGDAGTRALGLRTAGQVQADVGPRAQVVFTGGVSAPYRIDEVG